MRGFLGRKSAEENVGRLMATDTGADYALEPLLQRAFLLSRSATLHGGRSQIQRRAGARPAQGAAARLTRP